MVTVLGFDISLFLIPDGVSMCMVYIIMLILHLSVHVYEQEVARSQPTPTQKVPFLCKTQV